MNNTSNKRDLKGDNSGFNIFGYERLHQPTSQALIANKSTVDGNMDSSKPELGNARIKNQTQPPSTNHKNIKSPMDDEDKNSASTALNCSPIENQDGHEIIISNGVDHQNHQGDGDIQNDNHTNPKTHEIEEESVEMRRQKGVNQQHQLNGHQLGSMSNGMVLESQQPRTSVGMNPRRNANMESYQFETDPSSLSASDAVNNGKFLKRGSAQSEINYLKNQRGMFNPLTGEKY